ncbi:MAG TPA: lysophospholipid acyltransferase family protein [Gemmatales bacterium]|nr:lysophospholipid acyltransferase family protein [Gemmatales bacterium]
MAKERSSVRNFFEFLGVRVLLAILQSMSLPMGYALARGLAFLAYHVDRRHRLVAEQNLQIAFPQWTPQHRSQVVRDVYLHFCQMIIEMAHLPRLLHVHNWRRYLELRNGSATIEALLSERPIMVVTGHLGNWEMAGYALALFGFRSYAVARPLDNPWLDDLVKRFRRKTGQELLNKNGDAQRMETILKNNGILCTLADQDAGPNGLFVPFFGKPASTHKAVALLALHHEALVLVAAARRVGDGLRYALDIETIIDTRDLKNDMNPVRTLTELYTAAWERLVCKAPEQYLWLHRRWKHEPRRKTASRQAA